MSRTTWFLIAAALACGACGIFGSSDGKQSSAVGPSVGATGGQSTGGSTAGGVGGQSGGSGGGSGGSSAAGGSGCEGLPGPAMVEVAAPNGIKFCIDRTEVTQSQYADFVAKVTTSPGSEHALCKGINLSYKPTTTGGGPDWEPTPCVESEVWTPTTTPNRPVVCIDWCDAYAYCKWAEKRLCGKVGGGPGVVTSGGQSPAPDDPAIDPNQSQWYSACSQGGKTKYPYGDTYDPGACEGEVAKAPDGGYLPKKDVGSFPGCRGSSAPYASIVDMSGSVNEFTDECKPDGASALCAVRGGSFADSYDIYLACAPLGGYAPVRAEQTAGFRCCKDVQ